jgi:aconitate hydratase
LRAVIAKSYARIHWQNLANFGVLPLKFADTADYDRIDPGDRLRLDNLRTPLAPGAGSELRLHNTTRNETYEVRHRLSAGRRRTVLA